MNIDLSPDHLAARLGELASPALADVLPPGTPIRRAAVAALVRADGHVLLMRRVVRLEDRWSGQVSLPGGGAELHDSDLVATAVRETREELGRDLLASARLLGALPERQAIARGLKLAMTVRPYVFYEQRAEEPLLGHEASDAFWFPLPAAARGEFDSVYHYERDDGVQRELPCWRARLPSLIGAAPASERCVWGMTYFMLRELLEAASTER